MFADFSRTRSSRGRAFSFSPDGRFLAFAEDEREFVVCERSGYDGSVLLAPHGPLCDALAISPDGARLAVGKASGTNVFDITRGIRHQELIGQIADALPLNWKPDWLATSVNGEFLARQYTARDSDDVSFIVVRVDTGTPFKPIGAPSRPRNLARGIAFSGDGQRLAECGQAYLRVIDIPTGQELLTIRDDDRRFRRGTTVLALSTDGTMLAHNSGDSRAQSLVIRDVHNGDVTVKH